MRKRKNDHKIIDMETMHWLTKQQQGDMNRSVTNPTIVAGYDPYQELLNQKLLSSNICHNQFDTTGQSSGPRIVVSACVGKGL